ncbi:hypothetical protein FDH65_gp42 [Arthrobacter phage Circum]|uniref:Uncharacterized protein n=1 Tax=Arthrobacter phage Circum TaxID=1772295 RepID=A0A0U4ITS4_9CAUD|nr:hypothetical protein FDH65_gp42 [Arthrobacter phage Circum]ALY08727.1 hypothetical protein CIRCUM_42 [Arthrobacter phage Circum]
MEKSLKFKRKVYEVEAIQFKGEENLRGVLDFFEKHGTTADPRYLTNDDENFLHTIDFITVDANGDEIWEALCPTDWIVLDAFETPSFIIHSTASFARRYEGV